MRLFVVINFNDDARFRLVRLCDELRERSSRANITLPENLHLTLAFLGECDEKQASAAKKALSGLEFGGFDIEIDRIGRFAREGKDIWWAGVKESAPLMDLQRRLSGKLISLGFALENRRYRPHITIGREVVTDALPWAIEPFGQAVDAVDLMKSERIQGRLTYTPVFTRHKGV